MQKKGGSQFDVTNTTLNLSGKHHMHGMSGTKYNNMQLRLDKMYK